MASMQPIIRGVQAVGKVDFTYKYLKPKNGSSTDFEMPVPDGFTFGSLASGATIDMGSAGVSIAGFRLDSEFLRANPQIASSFVIPLLGGGGIALTNNNRTGTLNVVCAKVAVPALTGTTGKSNIALKSGSKSTVGVRIKEGATATDYFDLVTLAQLQQAQEGGDSYGAEITIGFEFAGIETSITFEMCTVATIDPVGLAGNDAVNYNVAFNYLNWTCTVKDNNS